MIHYDLVGAGRVLVLLHGFLEDGRMWDGMVKELSDENQVLVIDLPGNGKSDCLNYVHSMEDMADAVEAVIKAEKLEMPIMIGHSMGGYVALAYAENYGENLGGLGLFHSTGYPDTTQKKIDRERAIEAAMKRPDLFAELTIPNLFAEGGSSELKTEIETSIEMAKSQPVQGIVANIRGMMARPDRTEVFRNFDGPKLFVHGVKDPVLSTEKGMEQCEGVEYLTAEFLEGAGHMGHLEASNQTTNIIKEFVKTCSSNG